MCLYFQYIAYDGGTPTPMIGTVLLEIEVADANDNSPRFAQPSYTVVVPESTEPHTSLLSVNIVRHELDFNLTKSCENIVHLK